MFTQKLECKYYHSSFIYNSPKLEATQISISEWVDRQIVIYPLSGILLKNKKDQTTWMNIKSIVLSKRSYTRKTAYWMIPFTRSSRKGKAIVTKSRSVFAIVQECGEGDWLQRDTRELSGVMEMFYTLIVV